MVEIVTPHNKPQVPLGVPIAPEITTLQQLEDKLFKLIEQANIWICIALEAYNLRPASLKTALDTIQKQILQEFAINPSQDLETLINSVWSFYQSQLQEAIQKRQAKDPVDNQAGEESNISAIAHLVIIQLFQQQFLRKARTPYIEKLETRLAQMR